MKANELMIGDLVAVKPSGIPIRVAAIHKKKVGYHACTDRLVWVRIDLIEPIPLTEEILESNVFVQDERHKYSVTGSNYNYLKVRCYADTYFEIGNAFDEEGELQAFADIQYVHELQHALKLCGIDKEIEL